jgi:hypothetical protein
MLMDADGRRRDDAMRSPARREGDRLVEAQAKRQVRTFFDELKNGTRNYRTVASLSGQITQEYRGRCVLELLQNAHDALAGGRPGDPKRISFVLVTEPEPVLLIANSGRPFRRRDLEGICQLGQSPKDPNESVGNKGLGFQSVLEVSTRPQIWSTAAEEGSPEFVFAFDPNGMVRLVEQGVAEIESAFSTTEPDAGHRIINWSKDELRKYQERNGSGEALDAGLEARRYVSPYSIPLPIEETPPEIAELLNAGHVTVIRLRLDGGRTNTTDKAVELNGDSDEAAGAAAARLQAMGEAVSSIKDQLGRLDGRSVVFLPDLEKLTIEINGKSRVLERIVDSTADLPGSQPAREQVLLVGCTGDDVQDDTPREFRVWTRVLGGNNHPEEAQRIREAVKHLPNRWPDVRQVEVGAAVEDTESPEPGDFVIFLPTEVGTGTGAHINAPFYGSLDRRQINFEDDYNELLLQYVMDLALDVAAELAKGPTEGWRARAVIDLLASADSPGGGDRPALMDRVRQRAEETGHDLDNAKLVLCDNGWQVAERARIMPDVPGDDPLGDDAWREVAGFDIVSSELDSRHAEVEALLTCLGGSITPTPTEWAATIERLAARVHGRGIEASWDAFLSSLLAVLPRELLSPRGTDADPLAGAKFLPTQDGRLLSASDDDSTRVFFQPRRGVDDAAEFVGRVPASLQDRIAFLHEGVRTHEGPQRQNTDVQKFLDGRFVRGFRREDLLREVVIPALPELPATHGTSAAQRCSEILGWTLALLGAEERESLPRRLAVLPVACHGGWYPVRDAVFGPGWSDRSGEHLETLAAGLPAEAAEQLRERALLPPQNAAWGTDVSDRADLLARIGVVDGLRLESTDPLRFSMSSNNRDLPREPPTILAPAAWDTWRRTFRDEVEPRYDGRFEYELTGVRLLPGLDHLELLEAPARRALSDLILSSIGHWEGYWQRATVTKRGGWNWSTSVTSPVKHWLTTLPWLDDQEPQPLSQRWFVPASLLQGQGGRFAHLAPLSLELAHRLRQNPELLATLRKLGLNVYPTEDDQTGPKLLEALADAWEKGEMPAGGFDVFLFQVRHAWEHLTPGEELPSRFLVRSKPRSFEIVTDLTGIYLPDDDARTRSLRAHGKPIIEMLTKEAQGSIGRQLGELGTRRASTLSERSLADGMAASDDSAAAAVPLEDTELKWLPLVLLTLSAHGGNNPRGPTTGAWQQSKATLRGTLVRWCGSLTVELIDGDRVVARRAPEPEAHWLSDEGTLLLRHGFVYEQIAAACQAILERQDLLKDLRLVLGALPDDCSVPSRTQIERALARAEIDAESFADICNRWDDDATHVGDRIRPVLRVLGLSDDGLDAVGTEAADLIAWLSGRFTEAQEQEASAEDLVADSRRSRDDVEMGRAAFRRLGEIAQLPEWNAALAELGDRYATVANSEAADQAKQHIEEAAPYLQALARYAAIETAKPDLFRRLEAVRENFEAPTDWSTRWWEVPLDAVLAELRNAYADELETDPGLVEALGDASTLEDLRGALVHRGIDLDSDPYSTFRGNESQLSREIGQLHDLYRAWLEISGADPVPPTSDAIDSPQTDSSAYLRDWTEREIFKRALGTVGDADFRRLCECCASADDARLKLDITPQAVERARKKRHVRQRQAERKKRTFEVAGQPFEVGVNGDGSYGDLLTRLRALPEPKGPPAKSNEPTRLVQPGPGPTPSPTPRRQPPGRTSHLYSSPHLPGLVGIVGEMHAWRYLRSQFGTRVVTPAAWVSENGLKVLPLAGSEKRDASDSHGFDFRFHCDGITWQFEIKATTEDDTSFSLPPSEIRAATRLANSHRDRWRILRIRRALTDGPEIDLLPNPFETGFSDLFRLSSGGMTVRYALDANP